MTEIDIDDAWFLKPLTVQERDCLTDLDKRGNNIPLDNEGWPIISDPGLGRRGEYITDLTIALDDRKRASKLVSKYQQERIKGLTKAGESLAIDYHLLARSNEELSERVNFLGIENNRFRRITTKRDRTIRTTFQHDLDTAVELAEVARKLDQERSSRIQLAASERKLRSKHELSNLSSAEKQRLFDQRIVRRETQIRVASPVLEYFADILEQLDSDSIRSYETIKTETEQQLAPLLAKGDTLAIELLYNAAEVLMNKRKPETVRQARVLYEITRANAKDDVSIEVTAETRLLEIALCYPTESDPPIVASFDKLAQEDPLLKIARDYNLAQTVERITAAGMKDKDLAEIDPAILFIRAAYQLRNIKKDTDIGENIPEEKLLENILGRNLTFIDSTLELIATLNRKYNKIEEKAGIKKADEEKKHKVMQVIYTAVERSTDPELKLRIGLEGLSVYDTQLNDTVDQMREQKGDYKQLKQTRMQLSEHVKANPIHAEPLYHATVALQLQQEWNLAEEIGIALASATNEPKYWKLIGDVVSQSPTAARESRKAWAQECYQKANIMTDINI